MEILITVIFLTFPPVPDIPVPAAPPALVAKEKVVVNEIHALRCRSNWRFNERDKVKEECKQYYQK